MSAILHANEAPEREDAPIPLLRALVLCDLADSTALVERLGDLRAAEFFRKHDRLARALVHRYNGREIDKTDGFLMLFDRPIEAVAFALAYQRGMRQLEEPGTKAPLRARVGIHFGDVIAWDNAPDDIAKGAKPFEVEGLVKPTTSRLMQLALPGQILLSGVAYQLAHRAQDELGDLAPTTLWRTHGRYRFKGLPDPVAVFEVGEKDVAPLKAPPWSSKAHREVPFWRRPATMAIEAVLLLALVGVPLLYLLRPQPAIAFAQRDWVVVGDLKNLTDDTTFDDSLQAAFRIGLEQSRYVNVLSDLKTRDTVKLMQRDPEHTAVDRAIGSEVAIRDGARALILPTVQEIGGRVRVTAEVIDPKTQTTVWSESADGTGESSVLPSLDKVNQQLRVRLGEALATVSNDSQPLEKVATKNLDALRAYSLGVRAYNTGRQKEAMTLFEQALKLDGDFALARIALARTLLSTDQGAVARTEFEKANTTRDRLSSRDALYIDAWLGSFGPPVPALDKWKALATTYPDFFAANGSYGFFAWQWANRFDDAIEAIKRAASPNNPNRGTSDYLLGVLYLGKEQYAASMESFKRAEAVDATSHNEFYSYVYAAQRQFDKADETMNRGRSTGVESADILIAIPRSALAIDRGDVAGAKKILADAKQASKALGVDKPEDYRVREFALASVTDPSPATLGEMRDYVRATLDGLKRKERQDPPDAMFHALVVAYAAARNNERAPAEAVLAADLPEVRSGEYPLLTQMRVVVQAEKTRADGQPEKAVALLNPLLDGSELCVVHLALADAYAAAGKNDQALAEYRWLAEHRGRAYTEYADLSFTAFNVMQSDLALLRGAEVAAKKGDQTQARTSLAAFRQAWPNAAKLEFVSQRLRALDASLGATR